MDVLGLAKFRPYAAAIYAFMLHVCALSSFGPAVCTHALAERWQPEMPATGLYMYIMNCTGINAGSRCPSDPPCFAVRAQHANCYSEFRHAMGEHSPNMVLASLGPCLRGAHPGTLLIIAYFLLRVWVLDVLANQAIYKRFRVSLCCCICSCDTCI